jgi:uncharacterized protein YndB with AHSA1/START domain
VEIRSQRREAFPVPPAEVWAAMGRVDAFRRWWPWLHRFEAAGLAPGETWTCEVRPPVPYSLTFTVTLDDVVPLERVRATIAGDVEGRAELALWAVEEPGRPAGCEVTFSSWLAPGNPVLRAVAAVARPVARFGHDWVLDVGGRQFRERALAPGSA